MRSEEKNILKVINAFALSQKVELYLVGGWLRDYFLKRSKINPDIDFALKQGSVHFGERLARKLKAGFVVLDEERGCCRLVKYIGTRRMTLDFTDFRGKSLEEDLFLRDFTINAFCAPLGAFLETQNPDKAVLDIFGGKSDLKKKVLRMVSATVFNDDPVRILRAFSFAAIFGFRIEKNTLKAARQKKDLLTGVSGERIRDELFKIFESSSAYKTFCELDELKILKLIIPEIEMMRGIDQGPYHHLDVLEHSKETLRNLELLLEKFRKNKDMAGYLSEIISEPRSRSGLMKLGAFLHDVGKPRARKRRKGKLLFHGHERIGAHFARVIARRLKLSNDELQALSKMVFWHLRPGYLADSDHPTKRAKFRFYRDTAKEAVSVLLISLADQRSTRGRLTTRESRASHEKLCPKLIREYFQKSKQEKMPRLIDGNDLIRQFKLVPSPLIGDILREVEELQAVGELNNRESALNHVRRMIAHEKAKA